MSYVMAEVSTCQLREQLPELIDHTMYEGKRIGIIHDGKLAAVLISVEDFQALEEFELIQDSLAYKKAKEEDDGWRISLDELRHQLKS